MGAKIKDTSLWGCQDVAVEKRSQRSGVSKLRVFYLSARVTNQASIETTSKKHARLQRNYLCKETSIQAGTIIFPWLQQHEIIAKEAKHLSKV